MPLRFSFWKLTTSSILFDSSGENLISILEKCIYGDSSEKDAIIASQGNFFFHPSSAKDHLATKFFRLVPHTDANASYSLLIKFKNYESQGSVGKCCIYIQDENFSIIRRIDCERILSNENAMNIEFFFDVPSSALTFRLVILSDTGDAVSLPYSILIRSRNPNKILTVTESQQVPATVRISQRDNEIDRLQYFSECELVKCIGDYSLDAIKNHFSKDPWCLNYLVNNWEFAKKKTTLSSYPYDVAFAISGNCNSNCIFCITRDLRRKYKNRYIDVNDWGKFHEVLKYSKSIGIPGPGEPLLHPQFEQLISNLELYCDKRCNVYMITNGLLINKHLEFLKKSIISTFDISLNAATKETYQRVMGIGQDKFETVINNIRALTEIRNKEKRGKKINITFVVINDNLHELSDFINLGNDLKVDGIFIRPYVVESSKQGISTPSPDILNPYHNPHFTDFLSKFKTTMNQSKVPVYAKPDLWNIRKENCAPHPCNLLYNKLYLHNDFYKVWPCCIIGDLGEIHPIDCDGQESFFEAWNSSIMVNLRKSMFDGPLNDCCRTCNVDLNI